MKRFLFISLFALFGMVNSAVAIDVSGVWDSNWNVMTLQQNGSSVIGEYIYDKGVLSGVIEGNIFTGWWREYNNEQKCGPNNRWSGPALFKFSDDGLSFTGSWGYCGTTHDALAPDGSGWTGTRRSGITEYTQAECEGANRFWCNDACQFTECETPITKTECEQIGRNWCDGLCQINECETPITQFDCETSGMVWCNGTCRTEECNGISDCSQEELSAQYDAGKQFCIDNPGDCGINIDNDYNEGLEAGKQFCKDNPAACGLEAADSDSGGADSEDDSGDDNDEDIGNTGNCATFDFITNTLHVPCLDAGPVNYWIDMQLQGGHLTIQEYGQN